MKELLKRLTTEFDDGEYAHAYMESHAVSRIAAQIYALRKQRGWTQRQLSDKSGVAQERISKIESADFSSLTMNTLKKFSQAFDVDISISFRPFSQGIMDVVNLSAENLRIKDRESDLSVFREMLVCERSDGNLIPYSVPEGMSAITQSQPQQLEPLTPGEEWQSLVDINKALINTEQRQERAMRC